MPADSCPSQPPPPPMPAGSIGEPNAHYAGEHLHTIPLISWVQAGDWCESPNEFETGDAEDWIPCQEKSWSRRSFALRVAGDSMVSPYPGQPSYPHGTIIYVDPEKMVTNGARVVARANGEYTFKCYAEDMGKIYLKPLNPQYPTIEVTESVHICGVVVGRYNSE